MAMQNCKNCGKQFESQRAGQDMCPACEAKQHGDKSSKKQ